MDQQCPNCGTPLNSALFECGECGAPLSNAPRIGGLTDFDMAESRRLRKEMSGMVKGGIASFVAGIAVLASAISISSWRQAIAAAVLLVWGIAAMTFDLEKIKRRDW